MVELTEDQLKELISAAQNRQAFFEQAKGWFTASLSNSKYLVDGGQLLPETHEAGIAIYQQFIRDWTAPKTPAPEKKEDEKTGDE